MTDEEILKPVPDIEYRVYDPHSGKVYFKGSYEECLEDAKLRCFIYGNFLRGWICGNETAVETDRSELLVLSPADPAKVDRSGECFRWHSDAPEEWPYRNQEFIKLWAMVEYQIRGKKQ